MLIDTNSHLGNWPFYHGEELTPVRLARQLSANGIGHALVSPLGAVFSPDPMVANRQLFRQTRSRELLEPVPVINLKLATWRDQVMECLDTRAIRAVKILPNYHDYRLNNARLGPFLELLEEKHLRLIINVRLNDERGQYFALKIKGVPVTGLTGFLESFPDCHPLVTSLYRPELKELAARCPNFSADIAFCEWRETVSDLLTVMPADRLMLGTCTPLLSTRAQVDKLRLSLVSAGIRKRIGTTNARKFFRL